MKSMAAIESLACHLRAISATVSGDAYTLILKRFTSSLGRSLIITIHSLTFPTKRHQVLSLVLAFTPIINTRFRTTVSTIKRKEITSSLIAIISRFRFTWEEMNYCDGLRQISGKKWTRISSHRTILRTLVSSISRSRHVDDNAHGNDYGKTFDERRAACRETFHLHISFSSAPLSRGVFTKILLYSSGFKSSGWKSRVVTPRRNFTIRASRFRGFFRAANRGIPLVGRSQFPSRVRARFASAVFQESKIVVELREPYRDAIVLKTPPSLFPLICSRIFQVQW